MSIVNLSERIENLYIYIYISFITFENDVLDNEDSQYSAFSQMPRLDLADNVDTGKGEKKVLAIGKVGEKRVSKRTLSITCVLARVRRLLFSSSFANIAWKTM